MALVNNVTGNNVALATGAFGYTVGGLRPTAKFIGSLRDQLGIDIFVVIVPDTVQ